LSRDRSLNVDAGGCGGRSGGCACACAGAVCCLEVVVGDTKLSRVLILSSAINDQFDSVVSLVGCETGVRSPVVATSVVDAFDDGVNGLNIGGRTVKKDERDLALGVRLPGDCERLADRDDAVKTGLVDGVTSRVTFGSGVGGSQRSKGSKASGEKGAERHYRRCEFLLFLRFEYVAWSSPGVLKHEEVQRTMRATGKND
jgi:hypothetical protein